ncbi:MAG TPA: T9SS type A sorting domain-containing protein [Bacteroidia bacterium]|jgi:hypothetical protein|nr:T9SS type A sorting domain-containing protein [Bacteroidia bacterium]
MRKEIKIITCGVACFLCITVKAQYIIAGAHGTIYSNIMPADTVFTGPQGMDDFYYIDINQDGANDIKIGTSFPVSPAYFVQETYVASLNSNTNFQKDPANSMNLNPYSYGDSVNNNLVFTNSGYLSYYYHSSPPTGGGTTVNDPGWVGQGDKFIGVKYTNGTSISLGWVKVNVDGNTKCIVKEFSLGLPYVDIRSMNSPSVFMGIYPNPAKELLNIECTMQNSELKITNALGSIIRQEKINGQTQIDISDLQEGIYFVSIKTTERTVTKKIIVQH